MAKYHILVSRENKAEPWGLHFGDYDKEVVQDERDDITHWEYRRSDTKVLTVATDDQDTINEAIAGLNA